jgi:hypothetical protein
MFTFTSKEDEIRAKEKTAGIQGCFDFNEAGFGWNLESQETQDWITEGQQAQPEKKTASNRRWRTDGMGGGHEDLPGGLV